MPFRGVAVAATALPAAARHGAGGDRSSWVVGAGHHPHIVPVLHDADVRHPQQQCASARAVLRLAQGRAALQRG